MRWKLKMNDKKIIKKLAKESLKTKWKVMKKERNLEDKTVIISDDCAFCIYYHSCQACALNDSDLCNALGHLGINIIIKILKKIKRTGKIKETYDDRF